MGSTSESAKALQCPSSSLLLSHRLPSAREQQILPSLTREYSHLQEIQPETEVRVRKEGFQISHAHGTGAARRVQTSAAMPRCDFGAFLLNPATGLLRRQSCQPTRRFRSRMPADCQSCMVSIPAANKRGRRGRTSCTRSCSPLFDRFGRSGSSATTQTPKENRPCFLIF